MAINRVKWNNEVVDGLSGMYGFEVVRIEHYHLRLTNHHGKQLDYFPKSGKGTWHGTNRWMHIPDIEIFIEKTFLNHGNIHHQRSGTHR